MLGGSDTSSDELSRLFRSVLKAVTDALSVEQLQTELVHLEVTHIVQEYSTELSVV